VIDNGATGHLVASGANTAAASQTVTLGVGAYGYPVGTNNSFITVAIPGLVFLMGGDRIRTSTGSLQAGDNYGAPQLLVEEWLED